jgi:hypothetical protein
MPDKELRLLALDGRGVRGLSALMILGEREDQPKLAAKALRLF